MATCSIICRLDDGSEQISKLPYGTYILGRDVNCNVVVPSPSISRRHAQITVRDNTVVLEDMGSSAGTHVEGTRLQSPTTLPLPAVFHLGHLEVQVMAGAVDQISTKVGGGQDAQNISLSLSGAARGPLPVAELNERSKRRLEMLYELPLQFAAETDLARLYRLILDKVIELTPGAMRGALMIKDPHDGKLSLQASVPTDAPPISRTLIRKVALEQVGFIWGDKESDLANISASMARIGIRTGMYAPLVWKGETLGVLFLDNPNKREAFSKEDLQFLLSVAHYAASAVSNQLLQTEIEQNNRTLQNLLANFSPKLRDRLLEKSRLGRLQPGGEKSQVTILLSDMRGFTRTSANLPAEVVVEMLNDYFWVLGEEIFRHDGTIDKFIGDAILAVFGSPEPDPDHAWKAVCAGMQMQRQVEQVNARRRAAGLPVCELGVGVHTGEVLHGFIGAEERLEYTVIGDTVNKTSRYCDGAKAGELLIGPATNEAISDKIYTEMRTIGTKHEGDLPAFNVDWRNITLS